MHRPENWWLGEVAFASRRLLTFGKNFCCLHRAEIMGAVLVPIALQITSSPTCGMPPMSREMSGTVQRITATTITLVDAEQQESLTLAWNAKRTEFVRDGRFTSADALRPRAKVTVRYDWPIFGPKFVTRVSWHTGFSKPTRHKPRT